MRTSTRRSAGLAPWIGVYGIGAVAAGLARAAFGCSAADAARARLAAARGARCVGCRRRGCVGRRRLHRADRRAARSSLLQGNVPQDEKFAVAHMPQALACDRDAARSARGDLVVGPETVIPLLPDQLDAELLAGAAERTSRAAAGRR